MMADEERDEVDSDAAVSDDALPEAEIDDLDEDAVDAEASGFDEFGNPIEE